MASATAGKRGSERILERLGKADTISDATLKGILEVARRHDVEILDWCQFGQPGIDGVCGRFQVAPKVAGAVVQDFLDLAGWRCKIDVFPVGITDPEAININLSGGQLAR
jgi:hypothetical protein